jgi:hypothetical protein
MALMANSDNYNPRFAASWPGYVPGIGEKEIDPLTGLGSRFWYPDVASKDRIHGYLKLQSLMDVESHYKLFAHSAAGDAPDESDWIPVDFPGMLARLMRHYALGPEFAVSAKKDTTDPEIQRIFEEGGVVERLRQCAEAFPVLGDAVLRIDVDDREDDDGEIVPTATPKFIHPGCYHPTFDPLDATRVVSVTLAYVYPIPENSRRDPHYPFMVLKEIHTLQEVSDVAVSGTTVSGTKREGYVDYKLVEWNGNEEGSPIPVDKYFPAAESAPTGIDEIPIIHIPFNAAGGCPWGRSEFHRIERLILALENRLTQEDEILERHARPKLIVGPGVLDPEGRANLADFDVIEIDPSILEKAVKPEYLTWDPKIDAVKHQLETLLEFFFMTTETSPASFGMERSGSQVESARALRFKAHRTINKIEDLRDALKHAIKKLFRVGQKLELAAREEDGLPAYERSAINIHFPDPIIEDHTQDAQDYGALKANGLVSTKRAVSDLFNLDPDETQKELDAIKEDQETSTWLPDRVGDNPETGGSAEKLEAEIAAEKAGKATAPGGPQPPKPADAPPPKA